MQFVDDMAIRQVFVWELQLTPFNPHQLANILHSFIHLSYGAGMEQLKYWQPQYQGTQLHTTISIYKADNMYNVTFRHVCATTGAVEK
jgi:hypothetical protein